MDPMVYRRHARGTRDHIESSEAGIRFNGGPLIQLHTPGFESEWGLYADCAVAAHMPAGEQLVGAVAGSQSDRVKIIHAKSRTIFALNGERPISGTFPVAFGPGAELYVQHDWPGSRSVPPATPPNQLSVYSIFGKWLRAVDAMYDSAGIHHIDADGVPVMMSAARPRRIVRAHGFDIPLDYPQQIAGFTFGMADVGRYGGYVLIRPGFVPMMTTQYSPHPWFLSVVDGAPLIASNAAHGKPSELIVWESYDPLPDKDLPAAPRPCHIVDGGSGHLKWSTEIEGSYWAYDLWIEGKPAALLFHDLRSPLDEQFQRPQMFAGRPVLENGKKVMIPVVHDGEPVSTLWLAKKSGAGIIGYHDENVDTSVQANVDAMHDRVLELLRLTSEGVACIIGVQGYPRIRHNVCQGEQDALWCIEESLKIYQLSGLPVFLVLADWQGNKIGPAGELAYPELVLTRIALEVTNRILPAYGCVEYLAYFGDGRNDVSRWVVDYRTLTARRTQVPTKALPRTVVVPVKPAPTPVPVTPVVQPDPVRPTPGRGQKPSGKNLTKTQTKVAVGAAAGGIVAALGKLFGWW